MFFLSSTFQRRDSDVMIFAGGHSSGAHYNPAVDVGFWIAVPVCRQAVLLIIAQILAACAASLCRTNALWAHDYTVRNGLQQVRSN